MSGFLIDPTVVDSNLTKAIEMDKELKLSRGETPSGDEQPVFYSAAEKALIKEEAERLFAEAIAGKSRAASGRPKRFVLTAGAPGAGKTTLLESLLVNDPQLADAVYVDFDEILKKMKPY